MSLTARILRVLHDSSEPLSKLEIAEALGLRNDHVGRHDIEDVSRELLALAQAGTIAFDYPNAARPEYHFWIGAEPAVPAQPQAEARP